MSSQNYAQNHDEQSTLQYGNQRNRQQGYNNYQNGQNISQAQQNGVIKKQGFKGTPENAKTKICLRWEQGDCKYGDNCNFAHGEDELRDSIKQRRPAPGPREGGQQPGYGGTEQQPGSRHIPSQRIPQGMALEGDTHGLQAPDQQNQYMMNSQQPPNVDQQMYLAPTQPYYAGQPVGTQNGPPPGCSYQLWAKCGYPVGGPDGWIRYSTNNGEHYYVNMQTKQNQWQAPPEWQPY